MALYTQSNRSLTPAEIEVKRLQREAAARAASSGVRAMHADRYHRIAAARFGTPGVISTSQDSAALDHAAKAYQAANPGTDYVAAVKAVQYLG